MTAIAAVLKSAARILMALGLLSMAYALLWPLYGAPFMPIGLALWVGAFLCSVWRIFALRLPFAGRGGAAVVVPSSPPNPILSLIG